MELVGACGPRRNLVWFGALFTVLVVALVAYPVLAAQWPEYVSPTFSYQGGMMATGLAHYVAFLGVTFVFRKVLLSYMFPPEELQEQMEALNRETTAYYDGVYDAIKMILAREAKKREAGKSDGT